MEEFCAKFFLSALQPLSLPSYSIHIFALSFRYLEKAVKNLDIEQLKLVFEALHVREYDHLYT